VNNIMMRMSVATPLRQTSVPTKRLPMITPIASTAAVTATPWITRAPNVTPNPIRMTFIADPSVRNVTRSKCHRANRSSFEGRGDPAEQARLYLAAVDLIQHFVSSDGIEIVGDVAEARLAIALHQELHSFELLAVN